MIELEDSLNSIASARDIEELWRVMAQRFSSVGYAQFSYIDVRKIPLAGEPVPFFIFIEQIRGQITYSGSK